MKCLLTLAALFIWMNSFSQKINYADSVITYSTQYTTGNWSANQVLGYPNTYPSYGDLTTAWAHSTADSQREDIELYFSNPMPIDSIWVYETYNGGSIDTIYVRNPGTGNWEVVYSGSVAAVTSAQIFKVGFPMTTFNVSDIRIAMNSPAVFSWNEIDAVAIVNSTAINTVICSGDSLLINSSYQSTSGVYADSTLADADIEFITLDIANTSYNTITETACDSYTSPSGLFVWTNSNTYTDTIPNAAGCDSVLTINLTINSVNASTSASGATISATVTGASYQWVDCDDSFSTIPGETSQDFTPSANGNYAVIVTENGCSDTSSCHTIAGLNISEDDNRMLKVFPNPVNNELSITLEGYNEYFIRILDNSGKELISEKIANSTAAISMNHLESGIYYLEVNTSGQRLLRKIVKF